MGQADIWWKIIDNDTGQKRFISLLVRLHGSVNAVIRENDGKWRKPKTKSGEKK